MNIGALNFLGFVILGLSLLWTVRLIYGPRPGHTDDWMKRVLLLAGWILIVGGLLGSVVGMVASSISLPSSVDDVLLFLETLFQQNAMLVLLLILSPTILLAILIMSTGKYRRAEQRSLLWSLAVAAEKGIPLEEATRAFADERSVQSGLQATRLAELLAGGSSLSVALANARMNLPTEAILAARIGGETGQMGPALRRAIDDLDRFEEVFRGVAEKMFYLLLIGSAGIALGFHVLFQIIPAMEQMFSDFELELSGVTLAVIAVSQGAVAVKPLVIWMALMLLSIVVIGLLYYLGWLRNDQCFFSLHLTLWIFCFPIPLIWHFLKLSRIVSHEPLWSRADSAIILRALATAARQQRALSQTVHMLAAQYPKPAIGKLLERASQSINNGVPWCDSLLGAGLLRKPEAAVLRAAERVGNLPWAFDEMAESTLRRFALRVKTVSNTSFLLLLLLYSGGVLFFTVGVFEPLIKMISALS